MRGAGQARPGPAASNCMMTPRLLALLVCGALSAGRAEARQAESGQTPDRPLVAPGPVAEQPASPLSIVRIQRELRQAQPTLSETALKYYVQVYGQAPKIDVFKLKADSIGVVPWGAPTHQDFIDLWTPQEFRAPAADIPGAIFWLAQRLARKK